MRDPRHLGLLPRQRRRAGRRRPHRRGRAGGALHAARSTMPAFRGRPSHYCLAARRASRSTGVDHVVFYDKPFLKFERLLETYLAFAPRGFRSFRMAIPLWLREKLFLKGLLRKELERLGGGRRLRTRSCCSAEHHQSHAASAFFPSPFDEAAVLTMDGVGEWATTSVALGRGNAARDASGDPLSALARPALLGVHVLHGFKVNSGEYKVMGLAPYGEPRYAQTDPRAPDRREARRLVPARHVVLRLLHRASP